MATKYYNGVVLPEHPTTDLSDYPYYGILRSIDANELITYMFVCCKQPLYFDSTSNMIKTVSTSEFKVYGLFNGEWVLAVTQTGTVDFPLGVDGDYLNQGVWTNTDIYNSIDTSGDILMVATEPATKLWYGVDYLPCLPYVDTADYPYTCVARLKSNSMTVVYFLDKNGMYYSTDNTLKIESTVKYTYFAYSNENWIQVTSGTYTSMTTPLDDYEILWVSHDVLNADDYSVYMKNITPSTHIMYGTSFLPTIPEVDRTTYPYASVGYIDSFSRTDFVVFSSKPIVYNGTEAAIQSGSNYEIYIIGCKVAPLTEEAPTWTNLVTTTATSDVPLSSLSTDAKPVWTDHDIVSTVDSSVYAPASTVRSPSGLAYDMNALRGTLPAVDTSTGQEMGFYRVGDIITYEQAKQASLTLLFDYFDYGRFMLEDNGKAVVDISTSPMMMAGFFIVITEDGYEEGGIYFPKKGAYAPGPLIFNCTYGRGVLEYPDAVPFFDDKVTTTMSDGDTLAMTFLEVPAYIQERDVLIVRINGVEYISEVKLQGSIAYFGEFSENGDGPDFTNQPYFGGVMSVDEEAQTTSLVLFTPTPDIYDVEITHYMTRDINKLHRDFSYTVKSTIKPGATTQVSITTDNASEENPTYEYSGGGSYFSVNDTGLITATKEGSSYLYVNAPATENYHALEKSTYITVSATAEEETKTVRSMSATVTNSEITIGDTAQITVTDNAAADSPVYNYSSNATGVATVSSSGLITAVGEGTATITITSAETTNYQAGSTTVSVTVASNLAERVMKITAEKTTLQIGETTTLTIEDNAPMSTTNHFLSVEGDAVELNGDSTITAIKAGQATVKVTGQATDEFKQGSASIVITVNKTSRQVSYEYPTVNGNYFYIGDVLTPTITDNAADDNPTYVFTSSNEEAIVFDANGTLRAIGIGVSTIDILAEETANYSSARNYFTRTVIRRKRNLTALLDIVEEYETAQIQLTDTAEAEKPTYSFSSNDETIAVVDDNGFVTGIKEGQCSVTIQSPETNSYEAAEITLTIVVAQAELRAIAKGVLDGIADAIREANGTTDVIKAKNFRPEILKLGKSTKKLGLYICGEAFQYPEGYTLKNSEYIYGIYEKL